MFWSCLVGVLCASCICVDMSFPNLRKFFIYDLLKIFSMPLTWASSLFCMSIINTFCLSMSF